LTLQRNAFIKKKQTKKLNNWVKISFFCHQSYLNLKKIVHILLIMKKIAILASGSGSNAQAIAEYFKKSSLVEIDCILSNNPDAYVLERAKILDIESFTFTRHDFYNTTIILDLLHDRGIDFIVLAGFLWLVPAYLVKMYRGRIVNIHPALLPKYGGKGMFGINVHKSVIDHNELESGITIHYVNEKYDDGDIIFQVKCPIDPADTPDTLAQKVHELEYLHYPRIIERIVTAKG
jgi:phosphoribosylglycinamide formyltransferase-1